METLTNLFGNDGLLSLNGPAGVLLGFAAWGIGMHLWGRIEGRRYMRKHNLK